MFIAASGVSVLLAALLIYAAVRKLSHQEAVVASYERVGVPEGRLNLLAMILLAAAAGLLLGLWWGPGRRRGGGRADLLLHRRGRVPRPVPGHAERADADHARHSRHRRPGAAARDALAPSPLRARRGARVR